jgi:hypothetical protein
MSSANELKCNLRAERIKVIGLGGVGSILVRYLALFLRSLGRSIRLVLIDGDAFEPANGGRMLFSKLGNKARILASQTIQELGPGSLVTVVPIDQFVPPDNVADLIEDGDIVFLCVDNHATRKVGGEHVQTLSRVALFSGGNDGVDPPAKRGSYGNAQVYLRDGHDLTFPITKLHPEIQNPKEDHVPKVDCLRLAASQPQILFANMMVASVLLSSFFAASCCGNIVAHEYCFDIVDGWMSPLLVRKTPCPDSGAAVDAVGTRNDTNSDLTCRAGQ